LHVGGLRTALYSYLFAKQYDGAFILRIEDTDRTRLVPNAQTKLSTTLKQLGITYDEGYDNPGLYGPYVQSERLELYKTYAQKLIETKHAYYCFCTPERLTDLKSIQQANHEAPRYDRHCLKLSKEEIQEKIKQETPYVIRLKVPEGTTTFTDLIRGEISIANHTIDDQVLMKSDGYPTYHLAVVVDDHLMKITHVIRGEEWISSTPKHILLYRAFGWSLPKYAHLPLLLNPDKSKLSKRQGDVAVEDYLKQGYLPEALLNFVALLGWHPTNDQEIFSLPELISHFDLKRVQKAGAVFDHTKLDWMNNQYIKNKNDQDLVSPSKEYLANKEDWFNEDIYDLNKVVALFKDRLNTISEIADYAEFLYKLPGYEAELLIFKKSDLHTTKKSLQLCFKYLEQYQNTWQATDLKKSFDIYREKNNLTRSEMFWPLRVAITGLAKSPDVFEVMDIIGKIKCMERINIAIEKIEKL